MSDIIRKVKIKKQDGTFTDYIPFTTDAESIIIDGDSVVDKLNKKPYYYNTVADMKADEKLKVGDVAITLGYYSANDGGKAEYKILTSSSNYYETLDNSLKAELIIGDVVNIKSFGVYGDDTHDDTAKINACFSNILDGGTVNFNKNEVYKVTDRLICAKNIILDGKNSTIKFYNEATYTVFTISGNNNCTIKNITIDGSETIQDYFSSTSASQTKAKTGLLLVSSNVNLENIVLQNWYGDAIQVMSCKNFNTDNVKIDNIGGKNVGSLDTGHGFYFTYINEININIKNSQIIMKHTNNEYSTAGIYLEEVIGKINIDNSDFSYCNIDIKVENDSNEKKVFNINNSNLHGHTWFVSNNNTKENNTLYLNNCNFTRSSNNNVYQGIRECIVHAEKTLFDNSIANIFYKCNFILNNCVIDNITTPFFENCLKSEIRNSIFNYYGGTGMLRMSTTGEQIKIYNSTFNNKTNTYKSAYSSTEEEWDIYYDCVFNNWIPYFEQGFGNKIYQLTNTIPVAGIDGSSFPATVYYNSRVIWHPQSYFIFDYEEDFDNKYRWTTSLLDGQTHDLISTEQRGTMRRGKKYILIIVAMGKQNNKSLLVGRLQTGFDYCTVQLNNSELVISTPIKVGEYSSDNNVTINAANNTIVRVGEHANYYQSLLLPYEYINCIGLINS